MNLKRILNTTWDIVFYIFLICTIILTISIGKNNNLGEGPSILGYKLLNVLSESMSPTMDKGSLLIVKELNAQDIKVNDVITFKNGSSQTLTTHRVKEILKDDKVSFITQGDANNVVDAQAVDENLLVGKVIFSVPYLGATLEFIRENIKFVIGALFLIVIIISLPSNSKNKKEQLVKEEN